MREVPSDIGAILDARGGRQKTPLPPSPASRKRHRRRQNRSRSIDREADRLDAIARWLVSDKD